MDPVIEPEDQVLIRTAFPDEFLNLRIFEVISQYPHIQHAFIDCANSVLGRPYRGIQLLKINKQIIPHDSQTSPASGSSQKRQHETSANGSGGTLKKRRLDNDGPLKSPPESQEVGLNGVTAGEYPYKNYPTNTPRKEERMSQPLPSPKSQCPADQAKLTAAPSTQKLLFEARDISFQAPQRKKFHLGLVSSGSDYSLQLRNTSDNKVEGLYPLRSYAHFLKLPVPEKIQKQFNFCILPNDGEAEPLVWTINAGPIKSYRIEDDHLKRQLPSDEQLVMDAVLSYALQGSSKDLITPENKEFASEIRESHRKNDTAYHAKAHIGSKEGYLFFLKNGIFFGFKKPLRMLTFEQIDSVSYTSITNRDFNMVISHRVDVNAEPTEVEFLMIDQKNFAGVDTYVKRHGLNDASLAEERRAKKIGKASQQQDAEGEESELAKAEAELQDEEDEEEEDFDPDAGESETDSSGDEDDTAIDETISTHKNFVTDELGSEAEEVSDDDVLSPIKKKDPLMDMRADPSKPRSDAERRAIKKAVASSQEREERARSKSQSLSQPPLDSSRQPGVSFSSEAPTMSDKADDTAENRILKYGADRRGWPDLDDEEQL